MSIYKDCDIRGIYGEELTERSAYSIGRGLSAMLPPGGTMAVGGDVRVSTPALKAELIRGLTEGGIRVSDLGIIPTPALYFAHATGRFDGSATVTASHNPPEYNGIKFILGKTPLTPETVKTLHAAVDAGNFPTGEGSVTSTDILSEYTAALRRRFPAQKKLRVLIDAGNGAMSRVAGDVFRAAGHEVFELFCTPDGCFPNRSPNPADYSVLGVACTRVRELKCDLGVAFDGDGDRAVFIDETGMPVQNEKSLVLFIRECLKDNPTPVVYDQKSSGVIKKTVLEMGGTPVPERSGHAFIKKHFLDIGAAVAGEVSGHFFFGELGYDDGLFAALRMAGIIGESGRTLSELTRDIVCPPITPDIRVACPYALQPVWLERVENISRTHDCTVSHLDGVRLDFGDGWVLIRKSVTAEQITLRAEAETEERLNAILDTVREVLPECADQIRG